MYNYLAVSRCARNSAAKIAAGEPRHCYKYTLFCIRSEDSVPFLRTPDSIKSQAAVVDYVCHDVQNRLQYDTGVAVAVKTITDPYEVYDYVVDASLDCGDYTHHETLPEDKVYARIVFAPAL